MGDAGRRSQGECGRTGPEAAAGPVVGQVGDVDGAKPGRFIEAADCGKAQAERSGGSRWDHIAAGDNVLKVAGSVGERDGGGCGGPRRCLAMETGSGLAGRKGVVHDVCIALAATVPGVDERLGAGHDRRSDGGAADNAHVEQWAGAGTHARGTEQRAVMAKGREHGDIGHEAVQAAKGGAGGAAERVGAHQDL